MKHWIRRLAVLWLVLQVPAALAQTTDQDLRDLGQHEVNLGFSNEAALVALKMPLTTNADWRVSWLHAEQDGQRDNVFSIGFAAGGNAGIFRPFVGAKAVLANGRDARAYGLALHGGVEFPVAPDIRIGLQGAYTPQIVFGGDYDRYYDFSAQIGYQFIPQAQVYGGVYSSAAKSTDASWRLYRGALVGFKLSF